MTDSSSQSDRRIAYYIIVTMILASLAYFTPRMIHEINIERARNCLSCFEAHPAVIKRIDYSSGSAVGYGTSDWINAEYTFEDSGGRIFRHDQMLDENFEEGQTVTLRLYESELLFVDRSWAHRAWSGIELLLFLALPPATTALILLWVSRPARGRVMSYRRGYILLSAVVTLCSSILFAGGLELVWLPPLTLATSITAVAIALALRRNKHST